LHLALQAIPEPWDLYVTVPEFACTRALERVARDHPSVRFLPGANRGRDVLPFLRLLEMGVFDRYDAVCKLHSKRSPHMNSGDAWLNQVLLALLGSANGVTTLLSRFRNDPRLGLVGPSALAIHPGNPLHLAKNRAVIDAVSTRGGISTAAASASFFAGTMFWFRPTAMTSVRKLGLTTRDFPLEMAQTDGTVAHAVERLVCPLVEQSGYSCDEV
jgi:rhamnosyltransferase